MTFDVDDFRRLWDTPADPFSWPAYQAYLENPIHNTGEEGLVKAMKMALVGLAITSACPLVLRGGLSSAI